MIGGRLGQHADPSYRTYRQGGDWLYPEPLSYHSGYRFRVDPNTGKAQSLARGQAISGISGDYTENYQQGFTLTPLLIGTLIGVVGALTLMPQDEAATEGQG